MQHLKKVVSLFLCLLLISSAVCVSFAADVEPYRIEIHVSNSGSDSNSGTAAKPFATLARAVKAVSDTPHYGVAVDVIIHGGTYKLNGVTELFGANASGTEDAKVTYKAAGDGEVLFSGFKDIDVSQFTEVTDPDMKARFNPEALPFIGALDLKAQGFDRDNLDMLLGKSKENSTPDTLEYLVMRLNGKEQYIAQWPNYGEFATVGKVLNAGATSRTSKDPRAIFKYSYSNIGNWADPSTAIIRGYLSNVYLEQWNTIANIDPENQTIQMKYYNASPGLKEGRTWRVLNVAEELDVPGEYFIDLNTMTLYFYPPYKIAMDDKLDLSVTKDALIKITEAQHIVIDGLAFEGFRITDRESGIFDLKASHNITIRNCRFGYNGGGSAVIIKEGTNNIIEACLFYNSGGLGVSFYNNGYATDYSDYPNLEPDNNIIKNNHFYNIGHENLQSAGFAVGHSITSYFASDANVGNSIINNLIHHTYGGMSITAMMEYDISYNEISNACRILADYGPIYIGAYKHAYGNTIRYNYIHDFSSAIDPSYAVNGIYLDDWNSGNYAENNFLVPNSKGSVNCIISVGAYQKIRNNISVNTKNGPSITNRTTLYGGSQTVINGQVNRFSNLPENMVEKYGFLANVKTKTLELGGLFATMGNVITGNFTVNGKNRITDLVLEHAEKVENNTEIDAEDYSMFVDPDNHDWRIKSEYAQANGLDEGIMTDKNFSMDQIGIQKDVWDPKNPLDSFRHVYPKNGQENLHNKDVVLNWEAALFADEYDWVLATDPEFKNIVNQGTTVFEYAKVGDLDLGKSYYWKVKARNGTKQMGAEWDSSSVPFLFTTTKSEIVDKEFLKKSIERAEAAFAPVQDGTGNAGEFKEGTRAMLDKMLANAKYVYSSYTATQAKVDATVLQLDKAVDGISAYKNMSYITIDTSNPDLWVPAKADSVVYGADNIIYTNGAATVAYMNKVENHQMLKFKINGDFSGGWGGFTLRQADTKANVYGGTKYLVVIKEEVLEFQKYKVGAGATGVLETVPNNGIVENGQWHEIEFGAADADGGVQIFFKVDGETIFDFYDSEVPVYDEGYFCLKPPGGELQLAAADSVPTEFYEPPADIAKRGKSTIYTGDSAEFESQAKWKLNKDQTMGYNEKGVHTVDSRTAVAKYTLNGTREEKIMLYYWHQPIEGGDEAETITATFNYDGTTDMIVTRTIDFSRGTAGWKPLGSFTFNDFGGKGTIYIDIKGSGKGTSVLPVLKKTAIAQEMSEFANLFYTKADGMTALKIDSNLAFVNGAESELDTAAQIINGKTYVPLRFLADAFGYDVSWNAGAFEATISNKDMTMVVKPGTNLMTINGNATTLEAPALIVNGRTLLPVRDITEAFGKTVLWNGDTRIVLIGDNIKTAETDNEATFQLINKQFGGDL